MIEADGLRPTISALIILHNDHDMLLDACRLVSDIVDEFVIVDGAYEWTAPFLSALGHDPAVSNSEGQAVIESVRSLKPVRYFSGIWDHEIAKRTFAYEQCQGDIVYLVDADELHDVDIDLLRAFVRSDCSVAGLISPLMSGPNTVILPKQGSNIGIKNVMFKREQISALHHLAYLWLVLTKEEHIRIGQPEPQQCYTKSVGTNYHLSLMRTTATSKNRARFYIMNYFRETKSCNWFGRLEFDNIADFTRIFDYVTPEQFENFLHTQYLTMGFSPEAVEYNDFLPDVPVYIQSIIKKIQDHAAIHFSAVLLNELNVGCVAFSGSPLFFDVSDQATNQILPLTLSINGMNDDRIHIGIDVKLYRLPAIGVSPILLDVPFIRKRNMVAILADATDFSRHGRTLLSVSLNWDTSNLPCLVLKSETGSLHIMKFA